MTAIISNLVNYGSPEHILSWKFHMHLRKSICCIVGRNILEISLTNLFHSALQTAYILMFFFLDCPSAIKIKVSKSLNGVMDVESMYFESLFTGVHASSPLASVLR